MTHKSIARRNFLLGAGTAVAALAPSTPAPAQAPMRSGAADTILRNGKIITVDAAFTVAQSIAIAGDRILAVGADAATAVYTGPKTRVFDLAGRTVVPGLIDGHAHMDREGLKSIFPALGPVRSIRDIQDRIAELARSRAPGEWIVTMPIGDPPYPPDLPQAVPKGRAGRPPLYALQLRRNCYRTKWAAAS